MSEPIYLYDKHGELHVMHSPKTAHEMVIAGWLFVDPPAQPVAVELTPNDTQDVPVVPTGRARRKSKGDGGVL